MFGLSNFRMRQFISTYQHFFIVVLTLLFLVPCTLKRELKQNLTQETHQHTTNSQAKIFTGENCTINTQTVTQKLVQTQNISPNKEILVKQDEPEVVAYDYVTWDSFTLHKEKIPTHIRHQLYLI